MGFDIKTDTLQYYNQNAKQFVESTYKVDFSETQNIFLNRLQKGSFILDFGCGSGRDTKYFLEKGYQVEAIDGSAELCELAGAYTGIKVRTMLFQELQEINRYDAIWACSSILHLPYAELVDVMKKMITALRDRGIIYTSFKYGTFEGVRNGRYFIDMTEETAKGLLKDTGGLVIEEQWITSDARPGRGEEKWLNLLLRKK